MTVFKGEKALSTVEEHVIQRSLKEVVITPSHVRRTESEAFRRNKQRLREDGHYCCWVCSTTRNLQVHHFGIEWSLANIADWDRVKAFCEQWDPYGYGRLLHNQAITSPDDIRNLLVLCETHHIGVDSVAGGSGTGIHELTFPIWVVQKLSQPGKVPVPQKGQTVLNVETELANKQGEGAGEDSHVSGTLGGEMEGGRASATGE